MSTLNKVTLIANLTKDPESRSMNNGGQVVMLSAATNETWKDKQTGERKSKAEYHKIVIFNEHLGKVATSYLKKGCKIYIEGALQTRKWQDQSGVDKYSTEIVLQKFRGELVMLDSRGDSQSEDKGQSPSPQNDLDDDIVPF